MLRIGRLCEAISKIWRFMPAFKENEFNLRHLSKNYSLLADLFLLLVIPSEHELRLLENQHHKQRDCKWDKQIEQSEDDERR